MHHPNVHTSHDLKKAIKLIIKIIITFIKIFLSMSNAPIVISFSLPHTHTHQPGLQSSCPLQHFLRDLSDLLALLLHVGGDEEEQLVASCLWHAVAGREQGPGGRADASTLRVLEETHALLAALRRAVVLRQLLLELSVVRAGGGVARRAQQQDVVTVVVLHLRREVAAVLVWNNVLPVGQQVTVRQRETSKQNDISEVARNINQ